MAETKTYEKAEEQREKQGAVDGSQTESIDTVYRAIFDTYTASRTGKSPRDRLSLLIKAREMTCNNFEQLYPDKVSKLNKYGQICEALYRNKLELEWALPEK